MGAMRGRRGVALAAAFAAAAPLAAASTLKLKARSVAAAQESDAPYRMRLENYHNMQYHGAIQLGGQTVQAMFDSGSFHVLVVSQRCTKCPSPQYNSNSSATYQYVGDVWKHSFGSGPTESVTGRELVRVGPLEAKNQTIYEIVSHELNGLDESPFDAIVGIGPEDTETNFESSLLSNLNVSEYSVCLQRDPGAPGWLTWGTSLTPEQRSQAISLRVVGNHHWAVSMRDVLPDAALSEKQLRAAQTLICGRGCAAVLDSGTSLISAPSHALKALGFLLPRLADDCSNYDKVPDLMINLAGHNLRLPADTFALRMRGTAAEKKEAAALLAFKPSFAGKVNADMCFYAFIERDHHTDYGPLWVLGMPFFRHYHVTFGVAKQQADRRIWLSAASDDCHPVTLQGVGGKENATDAGDGKYDGVGVYPKVVVAQRARRSRQLRTHAAVPPLVVDAKDLVAALRRRQTQPMEL